MKTAIVPAQITTVEDRIAGSLGLSQVFLLSAPMFIGAGLYITLPPMMHNAPYKLMLFLFLVLTCGILAIRIKGKIVLLWVHTILRYNLRPKHYVFNKNELIGRQCRYEPVPFPAEEAQAVMERKKLIPLTTSDLVKLEAILDNPAANLRFRTQKGGLSVLITEVKD
jgi:hypothetical protein